MALAKWMRLIVWLFSFPALAQPTIFTENNDATVVLDPHNIALIEQSYQLADRFNSLLPSLLLGDLAVITSNLETLPRAQQEYILLLFCQHVISIDRLDDKVRHWLVELSLTRPQILTERHNRGLTIAEPAFNYPAAARTALNRWRVENQHIEYNQQLNLEQLDVKAIFNSNNPHILDQQDSLVAILPMQNFKRLQWLERELDRDQVFFPDNLVIAAVAMLNGSEIFYRRLWQRPVDQHSFRAAWWVKNNYPADQAFELLWIAAQNEDLTEHAWQLMAELKPMPAAAETYLFTALANDEMGEVAAQVLAQLTEHNVLSRLVTLVTQGDPAATATQNAWLSLFLNTSPEAKRLIKQLFELDEIRKNYGPVPQR